MFSDKRLFRAAKHGNAEEIRRYEINDCFNKCNVYAFHGIMQLAGFNYFFPGSIRFCMDLSLLNVLSVYVIQDF
jgi:hypothetical protein